MIKKCNYCQKDRPEELFFRITRKHYKHKYMCHMCHPSFIRGRIYDKKNHDWKLYSRICIKQGKYKTLEQRAKKEEGKIYSGLLKKDREHLQNLGYTTAFDETLILDYFD